MSEVKEEIGFPVLGRKAPDFEGKPHLLMYIKEDDCIKDKTFGIFKPNKEHS